MYYKKLEVILYILKKTIPSGNTFFGTYESIAKATGVSVDTVKRTMDILLAKGYLERIQTGVYIVSPDIMLSKPAIKKLTNLIQIVNE